MTKKKLTAKNWRGKKAVDLVTGFTGTVTSRVEYLNGCIQYAVKPRVDKDGKMPDSMYIDEEQLEILDEKPVKIKSVPTGGPQADCPSH